MKQLYVKLQVPSIELEVLGEDPSGTKAKIFVGFKRYPVNKTQEQLGLLQEGLDKHLKALTANLKDSESTTTEQVTNASLAVADYIKSQVLYIKKADVAVIDEETGNTETKVIKDTRTALPFEDFWDSPETCLDALLTMYLDSAAWKSSLIAQLQSALLNSGLAEDKIKN